MSVCAGCGDDSDAEGSSPIETPTSSQEERMKPSEVLANGGGTALILVSVDGGTAQACLSDAIGDSELPTCGTVPGSDENPALEPSSEVDALISEMPKGGYAVLSLERRGGQWRLIAFDVDRAF